MLKLFIFCDTCVAVLGDWVFCIALKNLLHGLEGILRSQAPWRPPTPTEDFEIVGSGDFAEEALTPWLPFSPPFSKSLTV